MKIEVGKYYKTRDGETVGPIVESYHGADSDWPWMIVGEGMTYDHYGRQRIGKEASGVDLVAPAYPEQGTLKEIGAKVGDVVEFNSGFFRFKCNVKTDVLEHNWASKPHWRIIYSATDPSPHSPIRTVTRKEIVPGVYGKVHVDLLGGLGVYVEELHDKDELTAAIETLQQIMEALE